MGFFIPLIIYALTVVILYAGSIIYYQNTYWKRRRMLHIEPVPIIGNNAPLFLRRLSFAAHSQNLYKLYPSARYYGFFDFAKPSVILKDPELIREVFVKNFDSFTDHDSFVSEEMDPIMGRNLFALKGQQWKHVRGTLSPSFTAARMKLLFGLIVECANEFVQYFVDHPEKAKEFECKDAFTRYTNDVIASAAFGLKVDSMADSDNEFYIQGKIATTFTFSRIIKFELMRKFPKLMRVFGASFLPKSADEFFKEVIKNTIKIREEKGIVRQDMIHLLMQAMKKEGIMKVDTDDVLAQAFIFYLAGFETVSSALCFICHELAANPEVQEKLFQEIMKQLEKDRGEVTYESLNQMKYLDMVINETLRKYPPAAITNRVCNRNHNFPPPMDGYPPYSMEEGTVVLVSVYGLHHDPKYYPEPEKFIPERFSDENKDKINPYTYLPFGHGPRQCIGNRFALMEIKVLVIGIVKNFFIKFTEKSQNPIVFSKTKFALMAEGGHWLSFDGRKKSI